MFFAGVIDAAQDTARIDLLAYFDFEDDTDGRVDGVFLGVTSCADHGRGLANEFSIDRAHISGALRGDFLRARGVGQKFELIKHLRVAALRRDHFFELAVAGTIKQTGLRHFARFVERLGDLAEVNHARR